ncbi:MAG: hypothetical protein ACR2KP_07475 [Egibacteraceae bacterium]
MRPGRIHHDGGQDTDLDGGPGMLPSELLGRVADDRGEVDKFGVLVDLADA